MVSERGLGLAQCSIAKTERRRFFWAVWWTQSPGERPFTMPDASGGGARTREEALAAAEKAAGRALSEIEPRWAKACMRLMRGQPAFPSGAAPGPAVTKGQEQTTRASAWAVLGLEVGASAEELKRAYRRRALETHPDRGGDPAVFQAVQRAYEKLLKKAGKPTGRKKRP